MVIGHEATESWHIGLRNARKDLGLSQRQLASRTGIEQSRLSRVENGLVDPKLSDAVQLARAVGLDFVLVRRRALPAIDRVIRDIEGGTDDRRRSAIERLVGDGEDA